MATNTWQLDPAHSEVHFRVKHLVITTVTGKFRNFSSAVTTEGDDFTKANIDFSIDTASVDTNVEARDNHLRSPEFFDSEKYPAMRFQSTAIRPAGDGEYALDGNLTIRDVTQPVTLKAEFGGIVIDPWGNTRAGFEVEGTIKRKDFGLAWDAFTEAGGAVVANEVKLLVNVEYVKAQA